MDCYFVTKPYTLPVCFDKTYVMQILFPALVQRAILCLVYIFFDGLKQGWKVLEDIVFLRQFHIFIFKTG